MVSSRFLILVVGLFAFASAKVPPKADSNLCLGLQVSHKDGEHKDLGGEEEVDEVSVPVPDPLKSVFDSLEERVPLLKKRKASYEEELEKQPRRRYSKRPKPPQEEEDQEASRPSSSSAAPPVSSSPAPQQAAKEVVASAPKASKLF